MKSKPNPFFFNLPFILNPPTAWNMVLRVPNLEKYDVSSATVVMSGSERMPLETLKKLKNLFPGVSIGDGYGMTESSVITSRPEGFMDSKPQSVGIPFKFWKFRIINDDGNDCAPNEVGEIILSGPSMMEGYYKDPEKTAEKALGLMAEVAKEGAELCSFSEVFMGGYPIWLRPQVSSMDDGLIRQCHSRYLDAAVDSDGPELAAIAKQAKKLGLFTYMGFVERAPSQGTVFCSLAAIHPDDGIVSIHRKLKPTFFERLVRRRASSVSWNRSSGRTSRCTETPCCSNRRRWAHRKACTRTRRIGL